MQGPAVAQWLNRARRSVSADALSQNPMAPSAMGPLIEVLGRAIVGVPGKLAGHIGLRLTRNTGVCASGN